MNAKSKAIESRFLSGKRGVAKSATGGRYTAYMGDTVRHGFETKQEARSHAKHSVKK